MYSRVTSQKVLTMDRFVHAILTGQSLPDGPKRVQEIFRRHLGGTFDRVIQDAAYIAAMQKKSDYKVLRYIPSSHLSPS